MTDSQNIEYIIYRYILKFTIYSVFTNVKTQKFFDSFLQKRIGEAPVTLKVTNSFSNGEAPVTLRITSTFSIAEPAVTLKVTKYVFAFAKTRIYSDIY